MKESFSGVLMASTKRNTDPRFPPKLRPQTDTSPDASSDATTTSFDASATTMAGATVSDPSTTLVMGESAVVMAARMDGTQTAVGGEDTTLAADAPTDPGPPPSGAAAPAIDDVLRNMRGPQIWSPPAASKAESHGADFAAYHVLAPAAKRHEAAPMTQRVMLDVTPPPPAPPAAALVADAAEAEAPATTMPMQAPIYVQNAPIAAVQAAPAGGANRGSATELAAFVQEAREELASSPALAAAMADSPTLSHRRDSARQRAFRIFAVALTLILLVGGLVVWNARTALLGPTPPDQPAAAAAAIETAAAPPAPVAAPVTVTTGTPAPAPAPTAEPVSTSSITSSPPLPTARLTPTASALAVPRATSHASAAAATRTAPQPPAATTAAKPSSIKPPFVRPNPYASPSAAPDPPPKTDTPRTSL